MILHYTINNNKSLNDKGKNILKEALSSLFIFQGSLNFEWLEQIKPLLYNTNDIIKVNKVISYENNPDLKDKDLLVDLYDYIINRKIIDVVYIYAKPIVCNVSPYYLKQYN
jgi:hypothetical protein